MHTFEYSFKLHVVRIVAYRYARRVPIRLGREGRWPLSFPTTRKLFNITELCTQMFYKSGSCHVDQKHTWHNRSTAIKRKEAVTRSSNLEPILIPPMKLIDYSYSELLKVKLCGFFFSSNAGFTDAFRAPPQNKVVIAVRVSSTTAFDFCRNRFRTKTKSFGN